MGRSGNHDEAHLMAYDLYIIFEVVRPFHEDGRKMSGVYDMVCPDCILKELKKDGFDI